MMIFHDFSWNFMNFMNFYDLVDVLFGEIGYNNDNRVLQPHAYVIWIYHGIQFIGQSSTSHSCLRPVSPAEHVLGKFMKFHEIHEISWNCRGRLGPGDSRYRCHDAKISTLSRRGMSWHIISRASSATTFFSASLSAVEWAWWKFMKFHEIHEISWNCPRQNRAVSRE